MIAGCRRAGSRGADGDTFGQLSDIAEHGPDKTRLPLAFGPRMKISRDHGKTETGSSARSTQSINFLRRLLFAADFIAAIEPSWISLSTRGRCHAFVTQLSARQLPFLG